MPNDEERREATFELDGEAEAELLESIAEAERGELIPAEDVLRKLRQQR
jgi:predicted transcriptional regulator